MNALGEDGSIMTRTIDGRIYSWNHAAEKLYGWREEEAVGKVSHDLLRTQFPKSLKEIESELAQGGRWEGKLIHTTRDGTRIVVESRWNLTFEAQFGGAVVEINWRRQESVPPSTLVDSVSKIATIVLAAGSLLCFIVLLHSLYRYHWTGDRELPSTVGIVVYYMFPALMAGLLLASLWLPPRLRINLALVLSSTGTSVYVVEMTVTFWASLPSEIAKQNMIASANAAKGWGVEFDRRTKSEVVTDLRKKGVNAYPAIPAQALLMAQASGVGLLPLGGVSNKVTVLCNENGDYTIYESDEHGFPNPKGLWKTADIVALGDSFVQGQCVSVGASFVALIRRHYPGTLNLGVGGQGPLMRLATLQEYVRILKPSVVLWFYSENDLADLKNEKRHPALMAYLKRGIDQDLITRQTEIDHALSAYVDSETGQSEISRKLKEMTDVIADPRRLQTVVNSAVKLSHVRRTLGLIDYQRRDDGQFGYVQGDYTEAVADLFPEVMSAAKAVVSEWRGTLYFVYLPTGLGNLEDHAEVMRVVRDLDIPIIDLLPVFQAHSDPASLFPFRLVDQHYNEIGNRLVADEVLRHLDQRKAVR